MTDRTDAELLDWLQEQDGYGLISDDFGRWAVSTSGMQPIPDGIENHPVDLHTTHFAQAAEWKPTVREAINFAIDDEDSE